MRGKLWITNIRGARRAGGPLGTLVLRQAIWGPKILYDCAHILRKVFGQGPRRGPGNPRMDQGDFKSLPQWMGKYHGPVELSKGP